MPVSEALALTRADQGHRISPGFSEGMPVNRRRWIFVELLLAAGFLAPVAMAQKPPGPGPAPPPTSPPTRLPGSIPTGSQPTRSDVDLVVIVLGRIATNDGSPVPSDTLVERICNERVRQQIYASPGGGFSMQMGSHAGVLLDATGDSGTDWSAQHDMSGRTSETGIPRSELAKCDLRASAGGFRPNSISLVGLTPSGGAVDVGAIVLERAGQIKGMTLSAAPYQAPPTARKAYEKGLQAEKNSKLPEAERNFAKAVEIYPRYASAWFQLGKVFEKEKQKDSARAAYSQAAAIDTKFLAPYLSLASMAYQAADWTEVLRLTAHISDLDPFSSTIATEYLLDLDELNLAAAYFYNAVANFKLDRIEQAETSAHKAEHADLRTNFPQLHILLAQIFIQKKNYAVAISELETYLELAPAAKNGDQIREQLVKLRELDRSAAAERPSFQN